MGLVLVMRESAICLHQETLCRTVFYERRLLRRAALFWSPEMVTQIRLAYHRRYWCVSVACSPLHLPYHGNMSVIIWIPNMSFKLKLRSNQRFVCDSLVCLGAIAKLRRRKPKCLVSCIASHFKNMLTQI